MENELDPIVQTPTEPHSPVTPDNQTARPDDSFEVSHEETIPQPPFTAQAPQEAQPADPGVSGQPAGDPRAYGDPSNRNPYSAVGSYGASYRSPAGGFVVGGPAAGQNTGYQNPRPGGAYGAGAYQTPGTGYGSGTPYGTGVRPPYPPTPAVSQPVKKGASHGFVIGMTCLGMVICLIIGAIGGAFLYRAIPASAGTPSPSGSGGTVVIRHETSETPTVTDKGSAAYVASVAADTVVEVTTETVVRDSYFGQYVTQGAGSGVIVSSGDNGTYILTCAHVIEKATAVSVKLRDGTEYKSSLTALDTDTDIGIIKIDVSGLPTATVGDFSKVVVGQGVVAIGNPLGELGGSVTDGIISALDRDIMIDGTTYHLLQTNAEINPGNSGGGLFDMEGKLIGIVNAKSSGDNVEGLGFAIPIDDAVRISTQLIENGYVTGRVKIGVSLIEVKSESDVQYWWKYRQYFTDYGVYIVESETDAFETGDRLIALDSITVNSISELKEMLLEHEVGDTVTVTISRLNRNGRAEMKDVQIVLTEKKN